MLKRLMWYLQPDKNKKFVFRLQENKIHLQKISFIKNKNFMGRGNMKDRKVT